MQLISFYSQKLLYVILFVVASALVSSAYQLDDSEMDLAPDFQPEDEVPFDDEDVDGPFDPLDQLEPMPRSASSAGVTGSRDRLGVSERSGHHGIGAYGRGISYGGHGYGLNRGYGRHGYGLEPHRYGSYGYGGRHGGYGYNRFGYGGSGYGSGYGRYGGGYSSYGIPRNSYYGYGRSYSPYKYGYGVRSYNY